MMNTNDANSGRPGNAEADARWRSHKRGSEIYRAGDGGVAWRVVSGSVRLDCGNARGNGLGGIAVPGDVIGAETLLFGRYSLSARALASCVLEPWPGTTSAVQGRTLLRMLMRVERRAAELLALRCGRPVERIRRLMSLLARPARDCEDEWVALPHSTDIADITSLTQETVSRVMAELKRRGVIRDEGRGIARVRLTDAGAAT